MYSSFVKWKKEFWFGRRARAPVLLCYEQKPKEKKMTKLQLSGASHIGF